MPEAISTRGQRLPQLLQTRSSVSLSDANSLVSPRRPSARPGSIGGSDGSQYEPDVERGDPQRPIRVSGDGRGIDLDYGGFDPPEPPPSFPIARSPMRNSVGERRGSYAPSALMTEQMRSQRLIGNSNPRYRWGQYFKTEDQLKDMKKPVRIYYERNNYLIQQYLYIDRLLDSSLPHHLIQEYNQPSIDVPPTIHEERNSFSTSPTQANGIDGAHFSNPADSDKPPTQTKEQQETFYTTYTPSDPHKVKRTPKDLYKVPDEDTPLLTHTDSNTHIDACPPDAIPAFIPDEDSSSGDRVVTIAIYLNLLANLVLLILKIIVTVLTSSVSVLASLVDGALDFLSTAIVWTTTRLISHGADDTHSYPVGRRRLEPIGVLVFSVIMITSFFQVALEAFNRLTGPDHRIVQLSPAAIAIMAATVVVKFLCWLYCRLIRNSSVQALAQDAVTDMVFNTFSIIFPLLGYYFSIWWLDPLGGLLLSAYVILSWSLTTKTHILNLTGLAASKDERNILLYLTMRFAHTIRAIQGLAAYHAGDKLNVEVDIVLDERMSLRDSHDLGESLQYVLESVPGVERAFVHADYKDVNLPSHMRQ
ncbi:MAG: hypothetical protein M1828_001426 [Chrysothrix sp. TS-e1954]|nr:MAG: hypothetical protein M1828_001426 [Chrysothrix sp. TS-e1954]